MSVYLSVCSLKLDLEPRGLEICITESEELNNPICKCLVVLKKKYLLVFRALALLFLQLCIVQPLGSPGSTKNVKPVRLISQYCPQCS